ncbi:MAG: hypothetical protein GY796_30035 [Chloroflexi bacterium]|nr:hypothetical protein [Chloroflexota bacterium]
MPGMNDVPPPIEQQPEAPVETTSAPHRLARMVGLGFIIIAVVLGWLLLVGFLGYQSGQNQLAAKQQAEYKTQIERQLALAGENIAQDNVGLAIRRIDWVLEREPNHTEALRLQETTLQSLAPSQTTPTPNLPAPTPTAVSEPSATPGVITSPGEELQRIRRLIVQKTWSDVIPALINFQNQFPSYEREETDLLLFDAYMAYSQELLESEKVELGLYYLDRAESLGNLPQSLVDYRTWAELYTQGISFYGANWDVAAYYFRDLCLAAPFYQNSCQRLHEILIAYGDQYAAAEDWCPAQLLYEEAWRQSSSTELSDKLDTGRSGCLSATPTPITGTLPITASKSLSLTEPLPGSFFAVPTSEP